MGLNADYVGALPIITSEDAKIVSGRWYLSCYEQISMFTPRNLVSNYRSYVSNHRSYVPNYRIECFKKNIPCMGFELITSIFIDRGWQEPSGKNRPRDRLVSACIRDISHYTIKYTARKPRLRILRVKEVSLYSYSLRQGISKEADVGK